MSSSGLIRHCTEVTELNKVENNAGLIRAPQNGDELDQQRRVPLKFN